MSYFKQVDDGTLNYRDNRDVAHTQVRNLTRRLLNKVDAHISLECATAQLEGREAQIDLSPEGIKRLIVEVAVREFGGGSAAIDR